MVSISGVVWVLSSSLCMYDAVLACDGSWTPLSLDHDVLVLFKAQLGEPFLETLIFFLHLFHLFWGQNQHLSPQKPALKWAKPGT